MRQLIVAIGLTLLAACDGAERDASGGYSSGATKTVMGLSTPASFAEIEDEQQRSVALYNELFKVISSPRCMNCHPRDDSPRQGDDMAMHTPPVIRGSGGNGVPGMECTTCHGAENVSFTGPEGSIPGNSPWFLAPKEMAWIGLSAGAICEQLKDPTRNGERTLEELHEHNAEDGLVGWGWAPGEGREPAPGNQRVFGDLTRAWIDTGAHCPTG